MSALVAGKQILRKQIKLVLNSLSAEIREERSKNVTEKLSPK